MKRWLAVLATGIMLGCADSTGPSPLFDSYTLVTVDGVPLPVEFAVDGSMLVAGLLDFGTLGRARKSIPPNGTVRYVLDVQVPDGSIQHSEIGLNYWIEDGILRIDLCPPLALCLISTELIGPIDDGSGELVLTHHLAGRPTAVYQFLATLTT